MADARSETRPESGVVLDPSHDPLSDGRIRNLLARYAELAHARLTELRPDLLHLDLPPHERSYFGRREHVLVALSLEALESHPDAEMALVGSSLVEQLLDAIRARGARLALGLVAPSFSADTSAATLSVPISNGSASTPDVRVARHPTGRLFARVLLRAGGAVEEHAVASSWFDLTTGATLPDDLAECCAALEQAATTPVPPDAAGGAMIAASKPVGELVDRMIWDLKTRLGAQVDRLHADAEHALAVELRRIDGYYKALLNDDLVRAKERRTIEAEHQRRASEERQRHQVRAVVYPLQMVEAELLVQRAEWQLTTPKGYTGRLAAHRALSGRGTWILSCPTCAVTPTKLAVCRANHVACGACVRTCAACGDEFCGRHGLEACHVDSAPACAEHARTCGSCRRAHCSTHEGICSDGDHLACTSCLSPCVICHRLVCATHARMTAAESPRGSRRLCTECTIFCEGGLSEPVGKDEVVRCSSCDHFVCSAHQAMCVVDRKVHCSTHLRRTDRSRRLVCETHRAKCSCEPEVILASDEVMPCVTCGAVSCDQHGAGCVEDARWHCRTHLSALHDRTGALACEAHRTMCHVDSVTFSLTGTSECPVCQRNACVGHVVACGNCGRTVCASDWHRGASRCATCDQLRRWDDPSDAAITAALEANGGEQPNAKEWRVARDATHMLVELALGWTRRTVLAVRHGESHAEHVMTHSALGSTRRR